MLLQREGSHERGFSNSDELPLGIRRERSFTSSSFTDEFLFVAILSSDSFVEFRCKVIHKSVTFQTF